MPLLPILHWLFLIISHVYMHRRPLTWNIAFLSLLLGIFSQDVEQADESCQLEFIKISRCTDTVTKKSDNAADLDVLAAHQNCGPFFSLSRTRTLSCDIPRSNHWKITLHSFVHRIMLMRVGVIAQHLKCYGEARFIHSSDQKFRLGSKEWAVGAAKPNKRCKYWTEK